MGGRRGVKLRNHLWEGVWIFSGDNENCAVQSKLFKLVALLGCHDKTRQYWKMGNVEPVFPGHEQ